MAGFADQMPRGHDDVQRRLRALEQQIGTILGLAGNAAALAAAIQTGLGNLATSGTTWAGPVASPSTVTATGGITAGGTVQGANIYTPGTMTADSGINSLGVYNLDVSTLPGSRRGNWTHQSGAVGYAPSTIRKKTNVEEFPVGADAFLAIAPRVFQYKAQIDIRDNSDNANYDPDYVVPTEPGVIAEELIAQGLGMFVFYDENGEPDGVNYDYFAAVGMLVTARDVAIWRTEVEKRLSDAEL